MARSAVLWERWGLDRLAPIIRIPGKDNKLKTNAKAPAHDQAFEEGHRRECGSYLPDSPLKYLQSDGGPIELKKTGRKWMFRTHPSYQSTMIALQYSRFMNQILRIPPAFEFGPATAYTRSVAPAFLYMHYNSQRAERHLKKLAQRMVKNTTGAGSNTEFDGSDLLRHLVTSKIPKEVLTRIDTTKEINSHSYTNSIRFEFLRQVYEIVFRGFEPEILPSPFLVDEL